jgi:hypothetical protein
VAKMKKRPTDREMIDRLATELCQNLEYPHEIEVEGEPCLHCMAAAAYMYEMLGRMGKKIRKDEQTKAEKRVEEVLKRTMRTYPEPEPSSPPSSLPSKWARFTYEPTPPPSRPPIRITYSTRTGKK